MKYIIISDLYYFFRKKIKYLIIILFLLSLYPIAERLVYLIKGLPVTFWRETKMGPMLLNNVGAAFNDKSLTNLSFYVPILFYTYLNFQTLSCYFNQLNFGPENVFLRLSKIKWLICKYVSIFIYTIMFQLIIYIFLIFVYRFLGLTININEVINIFIYDIFIKVSFGYLMILLVSFFNKAGIPIMYIALLLGAFNISSLFFLQYLYAGKYLITNNIFLLIIVFLIITVITFIGNKIKLLSLFTKEELI
ncbi:MAG: hypothetical protein WDA21_01170 [Bacilli bacterium]